MSKLSFRIALGYALISLILVGSTVLRSREVSSIASARETVSSSHAATELLRSLQESLSEAKLHLRDWVVVGDSAAIDLHTETWRGPLASVSNRLTTAFAGERGKPLLEQLARLELAQQSVRDLAHTPGNDPASELLLVEADPLTTRMSEQITRMIDLEKLVDNTDERKSLLANLADFRGSLGLGLASLRAFLVLDSEPDWRDFQHHWDTNTRAWEEIRGAAALLTPEQQTAFAELTEARSKFAGLPDIAREARDLHGQNVAANQLHDRVLPIEQALDASILELRVSADSAHTDALTHLEETIHWSETVNWIVLGCGLLVCLLFGYAISRMTTRPILDAVDFARALENGDLTRRLEIGGSHEANQLGQSLTKMAIALDGELKNRAATEDQLRTIIEASPVGMVVVDSKGSITTVNRSMEAIVGHDRNELKGLPVETLIPSSIRESHVASRNEFLASAKMRRMGAGRDLKALHSDGHEVPVDIGLSRIVVEDNVHVLATVVDITHRQRVTEAIATARDALARSNKELEQFAYVASHDLQEPLRKVSSFCDLLKKNYREQLDADGQTYLDFAVDGANRMRQLIKDLLQYSRVESQSQPLEPVEADQALEEALFAVAAAIEESGAEIVRTPLPQVRADKRQLTQLFQNLIGNAIKYQNEQKPAVNISATQEEGRWVFTIADNGIGIDPKHHDRIFGVFKRLHGRGEYAGTGIGLAICRRIAQRFGGDIWVESEVGSGSKFHFSIPIQYHAPQPAAYAIESQA